MYLYDEKKEIKSITVGTGEECSYWQVDRKKPDYHDKGVLVVGITPTRIVAVQVSGEMCYVTWFEVYGKHTTDKEELLYRVNQTFVSEIEYKKEE